MMDDMDYRDGGYVVDTLQAVSRLYIMLAGR